jgi:hypothetical protein
MLVPVNAREKNQGAEDASREVGVVLREMKKTFH